jgi:hypothetical protein
MDELDTYDLEMQGDYEDTTVADVHESIETNMWLAEAYFAQGAEGLGRECLRAAWNEHVRFSEIIHVYSGAALGDKLREMMVAKCVDLLHELDPAQHPVPPGFSRTYAAIAA